MRKGLRFQTRLMLAIVAAIAASTIALILVTETKVTQAYARQFSRDFRRLVNQLERSREQRSQGFMELSARLAAHPYVAATLAGSESSAQASDFWRFYLDSLAELESGLEKKPDASASRALPGPELLSRMGRIDLITAEGEIKALVPPAAFAGREGEPRRSAAARLRRDPQGVNRVKRRIDELLASDAQQTLFLPFELPEGTAYVQEMVSTPVKDPSTGTTLGLFLRATSAETEAQRFLERYQEEFVSDAPLLTGIFLHGQVYSRSIQKETASEMATVVSEHLAAPPAAPDREERIFEAPLGGVPHRFFVTPLAEGNTLDHAWQVSAFSLATLRADLAELRLRGSGVGLSALLLGVGIAWFFSRRLAVPVAELTKATQSVKRGELGTRIAVRSRDEIGELAESFNEMAEGLQQRDAYRSILGKVSDETVAQAMIEGALDLELGGELKTVTVLFCDIRGFAALTEPMPPTEVIDLLNEHMTAMTAVVRRHFGVVDKFVGDEIMAVFGGLKSYGNDAAHAAACALEMVSERGRLNAASARPLEIGIGLATGEVVAGCMGSVDRLNYTVVGARVNLASRLCGEAGAMEVLVDDATRAALAGAGYETQPRTGLRLKGFAETVSAHRLAGREAAALA